MYNPSGLKHSFRFLQIFEDVHLHEKPKLAKTLEILNYVFAAIFTLEFILKTIGFGIIKYFSSPWNCLDAFIVSVRGTAETLSNFHIKDKPTGKQILGNTKSYYFHN